jgi:ketosteroid isomerase-like protein
MIPAKTAISAAVILWLSAASPAFAQQDKASEGGELFDKVQSEFAAAYNRSDIDAMATAFSEDAVRVTPSGIFQGREAIRNTLQNALSMGLHNYSVRRIVSRSYGAFVFNAGKWQAKLGDRPFHGSTALTPPSSVAEVIKSKYWKKQSPWMLLISKAASVGGLFHECPP